MLRSAMTGRRTSSQLKRGSTSLNRTDTLACQHVAFAAGTGPSFRSTSAVGTARSSWDRGGFLESSSRMRDGVVSTGDRLARAVYVVKLLISERDVTERASGRRIAQLRGHVTLSGAINS